MKRKKHSKKRRRHRVSGIGRIGGMDFSQELGTIIGAAGGGFLNKVIPASVNPKLSAALKIVAGAAVRRTVKNNIGNGIGLGLVAVGSVELLQQLGVLNGVGAPTDTDMMAVSLEGTDEEMGSVVLAGEEEVLSGDLSVMNGDLSVMNGEDEISGSYVEEI
jgi:hypothetical protein